MVDLCIKTVFRWRGGGGGCGEVHRDKHCTSRCFEDQKSSTVVAIPSTNLSYDIWSTSCLLNQSVSQSVGQPVSQSKIEDWDWCSVPCMASKTMNSSMLADPQQLWCCRDLIIVFLSSVPQRAWRCIANLRMPQYKSVTHPKQTQTKWDKLKQFLFS